MPRNTDTIVYKGMTARQLAEAYDVLQTIPDPINWLHKNRQRAQTLKTKLNPISNVSYGEELIQKLDIYSPKGAKDIPVLIDIHGGGWTQGSKNSSAISAEPVLSKGIMWVPIDYGLAPEYDMYQIVSHVRRAVAWVYQNIGQYGGDPNSIYVYGVSAGGHLATTVLMPGWHTKFGMPDNVVKGLVAVAGDFDIEGHVYSNAGPQKALKMTLKDSQLLSSLHHLPNRKLPIILAYGEKELSEFINNSKNYAKALQNIDCDVTLLEVPGAHHFDMINELANTEGKLFKSVMGMIF